MKDRRTNATPVVSIEPARLSTESRQRVVVTMPVLESNLKREPASPKPTVAKENRVGR